MNKYGSKSLANDDIDDDIDDDDIDDDDNKNSAEDEWVPRGFITVNEYLEDTMRFIQYFNIDLPKLKGDDSLELDFGSLAMEFYVEYRDKYKYDVCYGAIRRPFNAHECLNNDIKKYELFYDKYSAVISPFIKQLHKVFVIG